MASRANLSGRPGPTGILDRVMNPPQQRSGPKISLPATAPQATAPSAGGVADPAMAQAASAKSIAARSSRPRAGLEQVGVSQQELAGAAQPLSRRASLSDRMARAQGTLAGQEVAAEVGGGRTEADVTGPTLNRARRPGRIYRS
jgi:hypothetical protein